MGLCAAGRKERAGFQGHSGQRLSRRMESRAARKRRRSGKNVCNAAGEITPKKTGEEESLGIEQSLILLRNARLARNPVRGFFHKKYVKNAFTLIFFRLTFFCGGCIDGAQQGQ